MDSLVVDLALHKISKKVLNKLKELELPIDSQKSINLGLEFEDMYERGEITRREYIFLQTRILLNKFCVKMESVIGNGVQCGFTFYSEERHKLYYGAGSNYPHVLKHFLHENTPTVCMHTSHHYDERQFFIVNTMSKWFDDWQCYADVFKAAKVKSLVSKRLRLNGVTFGTFETCFPYEFGPTPEILELILQEVQPVKEELYKIRAEMIEIMSSETNLIT